MGANCCKISGDAEIKFTHTNSYTNKLGKNSNFIKLNIINSSGFSMNIDVNPNWTLGMIKNKYCELVGKKEINKLIFYYKNKVLEENESPINLSKDKEITIYSFDGNDYNT